MHKYVYFNPMYLEHIQAIVDLHPRDKYTIIYSLHP